MLYGFALANIFHEMVCSMFSSFNVQICLLSSVEFLLFALRNDEVWLRYLVLKLFSVNPTYVCEVLLSLRVTVAW